MITRFSQPRSIWGRIAALLAMLFVVVLVASGCGGREASTGQEAKHIKIGYIAWDENIAVSHLYQVMLERQGYKVELTQLEAGPVYAGLAQGNLDLFQDAWLPSTHEEYWNQYSDRLEDLGVWYDQATLNIAVPTYMTDVNSIADLKGKGALFGGKLTGIEPSAGESRIVKDEMMPRYGLTGEYQLQLSSTTAMLAALEKATKEQQPIAVTLWHPHWAYARYPIKDLTDPMGAMGPPEQIHSVGRQGFSQDFPQVTDMIKRFKLDGPTLNSLENAIDGAPDGQERAAAEKWANENPQVVNTFAPR